MNRILLLLSFLVAYAILCGTYERTFRRTTSGATQANLEKEVAALKIRVTRLERTLSHLAENEQAGKKPANPPVAAGADEQVIETRIDGDFNGWDGETIFKLENGQIWQQSTYAYNYRYSFRPKVTIYRSGLSWMMVVDGMDKTVQVKRLK